MNSITEDGLVLDILDLVKKLQADLAAVKTNVTAQTRLLVHMREDQSLLKRRQTEAERRLSRLEASLNLTDAE